MEVELFFILFNITFIGIAPWTQISVIQSVLHFDWQICVKSETRKHYKSNKI